MEKGKVVISTDRERSIFARQEAKYKDKIVAPGFLRIEQEIINGKTKYLFSVSRDVNSDQITEKKLDRNDKFVVTHLGLFLMKRLSTKTGGEVLQTYPNIQEFADNSSTFLGADLEAFYNGAIAVRVGQITYVEGLDTRRFRSVEETQQSSASTKSSAKEYSGFIQLTPQITLDGNEKNELALEAPIHSTALVAHTAASTKNYLVLIARGFLVTNKK